MKLTYDPTYIAYLALRDKRKQVETIHLSDELKVDIAPDGTVYGIELLNAAAQLGSTLVIHGPFGEQTDVKLQLSSVA